MGLRCWLGWHDWIPLTPFRFISPISLMRIEELADRKFPDVVVVPVRLERCLRCDKDRGRASTPGGLVDADLAYVEYVHEGWEAIEGLSKIKVRGPVRRLEDQDDDWLEEWLKEDSDETD